MKFTIERHENYTWVKLNDHTLIRDISKWCAQTGCGKQVNFKTISFKNEEEVTMFHLRWAGQES
jgi:hypothetical protein